MSSTRPNHGYGVIRFVDSAESLVFEPVLDHRRQSHFGCDEEMPKYDRFRTWYAEGTQ